ncbi:hypothetical protein NQ804_06950 [Acinetobacter baumannii]|nr:hypothetical protein [Acinetobacter baumannii]
MNILNNVEAFAALQSGKNLLCRHIEGEFAKLNEFPATVFGNPEYQFCIDIEKIEIAGIKFTKPLTIDEYEEGKDVFVICAYEPSIYAINFKTNALIESINCGFVQRDAENAKLQLKAISRALGFEIKNDLSVIRLGDEPKKQRGKKSKAEKPSEVISAETQPTIVITEQTNVPTSEDLLVPETNEPKVDPEYQKALDALLQRVKESKTPAEVNAGYRGKGTPHGVNLIKGNKPTLSLTDKGVMNKAAQERYKLMLLKYFKEGRSAMDELDHEVKRIYQMVAA